MSFCCITISFLIFELFNFVGVRLGYRKSSFCTNFNSWCFPTMWYKARYNKPPVKPSNAVIFSKLGMVHCSWAISCPPMRLAKALPGTIFEKFFSRKFFISDFDIWMSFQEECFLVKTETARKSAIFGFSVKLQLPVKN